MTTRHLDLRSLECFIAVAEELSFAKAAAHLNLSQPPLTKRIQMLEAELGVSLFERSTRSVSLTRAGSVLLREARVLLDQSLAMQRAVQCAEASEAGTLRLGFISTAFLGVILPRLPELTARLGAVEYVWSELTSPQQVIALRDGRIDLAFVHTPLDHKGLEHRVVLREHFVAALPERHPFAGRDAIHLSELASELFPEDPALRKALPIAVAVACKRRGRLHRTCVGGYPQHSRTEARTHPRQRAALGAEDAVESGEPFNYVVASPQGFGIAGLLSVIATVTRPAAFGAGISPEASVDGSQVQRALIVEGSNECPAWANLTQRRFPSSRQVMTQVSSQSRQLPHRRANKLTANIQRHA